MDARIARADLLGHHLGLYHLRRAAPPAAGPGTVLQLAKTKDGKKEEKKEKEEKEEKEGKEERDEGHETAELETFGEKMVSFAARSEASIRRKIRRKNKDTIDQKVKDIGSFSGKTKGHEGFLDKLDSFTEEVSLDESKPKQLKLPLRKGVTINTRPLNWAQDLSKREKQKGVPQPINPRTQEVTALNSYEHVKDLTRRAANKRGVTGRKEEGQSIANFLSQPTKSIVEPGSNEDESAFFTLKRTKALMNTEGRRREGVKTINKLRLNKAKGTGSVTELFGKEGLMVPENASKWSSSVYAKEKQRQDKEIGRTSRELVDSTREHKRKSQESKKSKKEEPQRPPILEKMGKYDPMDLGTAIEEWESARKDSTGSEIDSEKEAPQKKREKRIVREMSRLHKATSDLDVSSGESTGGSEEEKWKVKREDVSEKVPRKKKKKARGKKTKFTHTKKRKAQTVGLDSSTQAPKKIKENKKKKDNN